MSVYASVYGRAACAPLVGRRVLRHLSDSGIAGIAGVGDMLEMPARFAIYRAGEAIAEVFFPSIACSLS